MDKSDDKTASKRANTLVHLPLHPPPPPPLLKDYSRLSRQSRQLKRSTALQSNSVSRNYNGDAEMQHRLEAGRMMAGGRQQTSLGLTPNPVLTARYYTEHKKRQPEASTEQLTQTADRTLYDALEAEAAAAGLCKRYPFSQVVYSNILTSGQSAGFNTGKSEPAARHIKPVAPLLSYLPKPGGLPLPSSALSSTGSPSFVHQRRVARQRSNVSGPLDRAMASDRSSEAVVHRAITQLRHAMHLPAK